MINQKINQLKRIKEKLNSQKLSVLVGAGFSKNVSYLFPDWWELIYDIAYDSFKSEISDSYFIYLSSLKSKSNSVTEKEFIEKKVGEIIEREGFLEIVSKYVKKQGVRESIATYIEKKTPHIDVKGKKSYLIKKSVQGSSVLLTPKLLTQHKMLLQLPWNNIYTTNYDTLLEHCVDNNLEAELKSRIKKLVEANERLFTEEQKLKAELSKLMDNESLNNTKIDEIKKISKNPILAGVTIEEEHMVTLDELLKQNAGILQNKIKVDLKLNSLNQELMENESILQKLNTGLNECLTIVKHSSELRIKRNKNIIKLHGTLRANEDDDYGFDGDVHKHYVIAKEDYESYPTKHEAFTQLMRISLLQESFVLIGFSGVDPNFISWIGWVRDILERKPDGNNTDYKVYLIDINAKPISDDKKLFYKNHRIVHIPLLEKEIIEFLESETSSKLNDKTNYKEVFELLFAFLSDNHSVNRAKNILEILQQDEYRIIWKSKDFNNPKEFDFYNGLDKMKRLEKLFNSERIPLFNAVNLFTKRNLLVQSYVILNQVKRDDKKLLIFSKLTCMAMHDTYLLPSLIWDEKELIVIRKIIKGKFSKLLFEKLLAREYLLRMKADDFKAVLQSPSFIKNNTKDSLMYESILFSAFSLDFKELFKKVQMWNPKPSKAINKAGLLALFSPKQSEEYLSVYVNNSEISISQEQLYVMKLLRYIKNAISRNNQNIMLNQKIKEYERFSIDSFDANITSILDDLKKNQTNLEPYGDGRFKVRNKFIFSNDPSKLQKGLQFIQMLIEAGFPLCLNNVYYKKHEEWYLVLKNIYEDFPLPVLYYTLQYSDEKFLRRTAQDFIYSDVLRYEIADVFRLLLNAYLQEETPLNIKRNILMFSSEFFVASSPVNWQHQFLRIWKLLFENKILFNEDYVEENSFVNMALPYIQEISVLQTIINDLLYGYEVNQNAAIRHLFYLSRNNVVAIEGEKLQNNKIGKKLELIIESIPDSPAGAIFILGNLSRILNEDNRIEIKNKLSKTDFFKVDNERVWRVVLYFSYGDSTILNKIKIAIIESDKLWYSGITNDGISFNQSEYIKLQSLNKSKLRENGIFWTKSETRKIFILLKSEYEKIKKAKSKNLQFNFKSILEEMHSFLLNEKDNLIDITDYKIVYNEVKASYFEARGYMSLYEGLLSENNSTVIWALNEMFSDIYYDEKIKYENEIQLLLSKICFQKGPSIEECLSHVTYFFFRYHDNLILHKYANQLNQILVKYKENELLEYDKPFVEHLLIKIAKVLKKWNLGSETVEYWLDVENKSNYNNIRLGAGE